MIECNVLIVGSGPAGMSAAYHLSKAGVGGVIVLERLSDAPYRRYHEICGEAVSERMFRMIVIEPCGVMRHVDSIRISFPGEISIDIGSKGYIIDRNEMLGDLRSKCDAEFVRGTATGVSTEDGMYVIRTGGEDIRCRYLIGADGAHSVVRRDVFGSEPSEMMPIVNNIVAGDCEPVLNFIVDERYAGGYKWVFPSKEGLISTGYPKGTDDVDGVLSVGARHMPIGRLPSVADGRCCLIGDAASLANPLCFGGIGAALLSGRKAAECIASDDLGPYSRWVLKDIMFDRHFMDAHTKFIGWNNEDISEAMRPFRGGYSILRGLLAMIRNPRWANVYFSCWIGFRRGW